MPTDDATPPDHSPRRPPEAHFPDAPFPYLRWAKANLDWEDLGLGMSGLQLLPEAERRRHGMAPVSELGDPAGALKAALSERYGLRPENVHLSAGTSHANFTVYLAMARGTHVAVERPAYQAFLRLAPAVDAACDGFDRTPEAGWRIDSGSLAAAVRPDTSLIVVSDLHNPSGARLADDDLDLLVEHAAAVDAYVLVDEVFADLDPLERPTAAQRHPRVLVTNSLTKAHGLPDLRAGWVLGAPDAIHAIETWDDLVHPGLPPAPLADAARYVPHARSYLQVTRERAAARAAQVDAWVQRTPRVHWTPPDAGFTGFLRLGEPGEVIDGDAFAARLHADVGVRVVPGSFFQLPGWMRISFMLEPDALERALTLIGDSL